MSGQLETEEELDLFLDKIKNEYKDAWTEENWEEEMEKHPFFMTNVPDDAAELPPAVEALRKIKWDEEDGPKEKAMRLKEEGNLYFKVKNYKNAVACYTRALAEPLKEESELQSILYSNRSAAHFHLKNNRSALNDAVFALKFNASNLKAIYKCAECCLELKNYEDAIKWCERGLKIEPKDAKLRDIVSKSETSRKLLQRDQRKKELEERKVNEVHMKILNLIKSKKIRVQEKTDKQFLFHLENPMSTPNNNSRVQLGDDGLSLKWPVIFLYPEYGQTDFVEIFDENSTFNDHLSVMFSEAPGWDERKDYALKNLRVYYENRDKKRLVRLKRDTTLVDALTKEGYIVQMGVPSFLILVANSAFEKTYLDKYSEIGNY